MPAIGVLVSNDDITLVQVDPPFCTFAVATPMGARFDTDASALAVNANYFHERMPIGVMVQDGEVLTRFIPLPEPKPRTALVLIEGHAHFTEPLAGSATQAVLDSGQWSDATVIQAGPRLLRDGNIVTGDPENISGSGALRTAEHVGIGITAAGKLLFLYAEEISPTDLARLLARHGAIDAMKVDGGHAAYLRHGRIRRGVENPFTALVVTPRDA